MKHQILNRAWAVLLALLLPLGLMAQTRSVRGVVTGDSGDPLPGVVIVDQVSGRATSTAPDGSYSIEAGKDAILQFLLELCQRILITHHCPWSHVLSLPIIIVFLYFSIKYWIDNN